VHLADERADFAIREFVDAVAEKRLVLGQRRQRATCHSRVLSCHGRNVSTPTSTWCPPSGGHAAVRLTAFAKAPALKKPDAHTRWGRRKIGHGQIVQALCSQGSR